MKTSMNRFKPTLLSVLISSALLSACGSSDDGIENKPDTDSNLVTLPSANTPFVLEDENAREEFDYSVSKVEIEEVVVTGARLIRSDSAAASSAKMERRVQVMPQAYDIVRPELSQETYAEMEDSEISRVAQNAVSTFSIDVDTGAYSNVRRFLNGGNLPPADAVRAEELINYFSYDYPQRKESQPEDSSVPFSFSTEVSLSPWNPDKHLVHIGLQAFDPEGEDELASNLVFLLDVSGSMNSPDKLDLLKTSLKMLSRQLDAQDSVSIVVYAGASGVVLEPTGGDESRKISTALDRLSAGGSTNGEAGIQLAYSLAQDAFIDGGINRVILATDGDFNVGMADIDALKELISQKRESGISLTTLGFGSGNYNDHLMEQLADVGNGNYAYIDNINEARKVLVDEMSSTLQTVAKDVKIQIEFNPAVVSEYRLIGYENRALKREDFNNDKIDAGEIGAGHTVTAIYEISLAGSEGLSVDPLRYGNENAENKSVSLASDSFDFESELAYLKLRYKDPDSSKSKLLEKAILVGDIQQDIKNTSNDYRFSAAVAGLAQLLRNNKQTDELDYDRVLSLASDSKGNDEFGYRSEFINLVRTAQTLSFN